MAEKVKKARRTKEEFKKSLASAQSATELKSKISAVVGNIYDDNNFPVIYGSKDDGNFYNLIMIVNEVSAVWCEVFSEVMWECFDDLQDSMFDMADDVSDGLYNITEAIKSI